MSFWLAPAARGAVSGPRDAAASDAVAWPAVGDVPVSTAAGVRLARWTAIGALASMFLMHLGLLTFVDPDLFHEMALAREALALGRLPLEDRFAYTPTVYPSVHHEWGTGAVLYAATAAGGAPALMGLKYLLAFGIAALALRAARRAGAAWETILMVAPVTILAGIIGFTTIRAQVFTLAGLALLLNFLEADRQGRRGWVGPWLVVYGVWLNLHAGFVVGAAFYAAHAAEQFCRRRPVGHLLLGGAAMAALVAVNPYGPRYVGYLAHGLTLPRPLITEWQPLWTGDPTMFTAYLLSLVLLLYAVGRVGWRRLPGLVLVLLAAIAAARHTRHVSLYLVVWLALAPGYLQLTPLGEALRGTWRRRHRWVAAGAALVMGFCLARSLPAEPWRMRVPTTPADEAAGLPVYPVAAVDYLERADFAGNLFVPFVPGGYVSWRLHPHVKVSLDGRYEVAYQHGILEENVAFYRAEPGWEATLARYPTDLVLAPRSGPLAAALEERGDWPRVYEDATYALYARPGLTLPPADRLPPLGRRRVAFP